MGEPLDWDEVEAKRGTMDYEDWKQYIHEWLEKKLEETLKKIKKMFPNIIHGKFRAIVLMREEY